MYAFFICLLSSTSSSLAVVFVSLSTYAQKYEYKIITTVESIIPSGLGRSRIISSNEDRNYKDFTTERS